ncbi:ribonuclease H-like protein [Mycena polygramma]|nr:ribonuclease H-like protein [Mycena polygramma]
MDQFLAKWDPRAPDPAVVARNPLPDGEVRFVPPPGIKRLAEGYRIFTKPQPGTPAVDPVALQAPLALPPNVVNAAISGHVENSGFAEARCGAGIWFSIDDPRNTGFRVTKSVAQTSLNAEVMATLHCVQSVQLDIPLRISIRGDTIPTILNSSLGKWEDKGWIGEPIQALAMYLRRRRADTTFVKLRNTGASLPYKQASQLARDGAASDIPKALDVSTTHGPHLRGAKLATLTQALAYKAIKELRATPSRKTTEANVKLIQDAGRLQRGKTPTVASIWKSVRHKDLSRQIKTFLWKSIHGAHRVGKFWTNIPGYEDRATCEACGEVESLEHILLECKCPGQADIWKLASELWAKKFGVMPPPTTGGILGCCLASFESETKSKPSGVNRLFRILISESAYLIWKLRCERVIGRDGEAHSVAEIHNHWVQTLNDRLEIDRFMACDLSYQGRQVILPAVVLRTWSRTLLDEGKLPQNWLREPKVLVGIVSKRSQQSPSPDSGG